MPKLLYLFSIAVWMSLSLQVQTPLKERHLVKIKIEQQANFRLLEDLHLDLATQRMGRYAEVVATNDEIREIRKRGFETEIIPVDPPGMTITQYRSYEEIIALCQQYAAEYPDILILDTLGFSQTWHLWMPVLKISDHPETEEDEPAVLYDGLHHAREPVGMESAIYIMEYLLKNYGTDDQVTQWVNDYEIWFIPIINPEGYKYLIDNSLTSPWWRKNLRDNDEDGAFDPNVDGVDLNRNYNYYWDMGSSDWGSWTYRGPEPFSESETRAKRALALKQKFLLSHSYHSYGEVIIYPWSDLSPPPDRDLIAEIAGEVAKRIPSVTGNGSYDTRTSTGRVGFSKNWMYAVAGTIEFTVETAAQFVPPVNQGMAIARSNLNGGLYLLERMRGPGITGHVTDEATGQPLVATVKLLGYDNDLITPRTTDSIYGRYWRLTQSGTYSLRFSCDGYEAQIIHQIEVNDSNWTDVSVALKPVSTGTGQLIISKPVLLSGLKGYPNPFNQQVHINFQLHHPTPVIGRITDLHGRIVREWINNSQLPGSYEFLWDGCNTAGSMVPHGVYLMLIQAGEEIQLLRLVKIN
ncbi:MAG: carboxypeptidase regulatory-like domain-containing protein [Bacteroidales bacterium]|nr:carboxypeptidase regulatory-like domain-containing protein [Bacteroidales bacterium]